MKGFELNDLVVCISNDPADTTNLLLDKFYIVKRTSVLISSQVAIIDLSGNEIKWTDGFPRGYASSRFKKVDIPQIDKEVLINANKGSC